MRLAALLAASCLAVACGPPKDATPVTRCTGTVSGGVTGTIARCSPFDQLYRQNLDTFLFVAGYEERTLGISYSLSANVELAGEPSSGRSFENPVCTITVTSGGRTWASSTGGNVRTGGCELSFSEVAPYAQTGNTISYCILRGTLTGTLPEDTLSSAPVDTRVRLEFDHSPSATDQDRQRELCKKYGPPEK